MQNPKNAPAGFGTRWIAYIIDCLLVGLVVGLTLFPAKLQGLFDTGSIWNKQILFDFTTYAVAAYIVRAVYFVITTYAMGATLGKKLLRIHVETAEGEKLTFINVLFRETVGRFLSGIFYVGYLVALAGKEHIALHDMLCDTRVCYQDLAEIVHVKVLRTPNPYQPERPGQQSSYTMPQCPPKAPVQEPTPVYREGQPGSGEQSQPQNQGYVMPQSGYTRPQNAAPRDESAWNTQAHPEEAAEQSVQNAAEQSKEAAEQSAQNVMPTQNETVWNAQPQPEKGETQMEEVAEQPVQDAAPQDNVPADSQENGDLS